MPNPSKMLELAKAARANAYAPYSNFPVGCCLVSEKGNYYAGCNVENSAYPQSQCAETSAIGSLISAGDKKIAAILVITDTPKGVEPCGGCLQKLSEFIEEDAQVYIANTEGIVRDFKFYSVFTAKFAQEFKSLQGHKA